MEIGVQAADVYALRVLREIKADDAGCPLSIPDIGQSTGKAQRSCLREIEISCLLVGGRRCLPVSERGLDIACKDRLGVSDLIIVAAGTDILIMPRGESQSVRKIVEARTKG